MTAHGRLRVLRLWIVIWALFAPVAMPGQFAGGTGTSDDPYQIATAEQLVSIGSSPNLLNKHFILVRDIDLDPNLTPAYAFGRAVIGEFSGGLNGSGFRIRHLTIRIPQKEEKGGAVGLFVGIDGGEVKDLILEDVSILAPSSYDAGALCAFNAGTVSRCAVTGTVSGGENVGGLVGYSCYVGRHVGDVSECSSVCTVSGRCSGGLIARNQGSVRDCYASGSVSGEWVGGLVGTHEASWIERCYAACQVNATGPSGGLASVQYPSSKVVHSYFCGGRNNGIGTPLTEIQMKLPSSLAGWDFWGIGNDGFRVPWFMPENGYPELTWLALADVPDISGLSVEEAFGVMKQADIEVRDIVCDYDHVAQYGHVIMTRPHPNELPGKATDVVVSLGEYDWSANPGTGEPNDPYLVLSVGQFDCLVHQPQLWSKCFELIADLDMAWRVYEMPMIGLPEAKGGVFRGRFDGHGHTIRNLTLEGSRPLEGGVTMLGLFGEIGPAGSIMDLGLKDISIAGASDQQGTGGMLCAINEGHIAGCYSIGMLQGRGTLGGLAGRNTGIIEDCYAQGTVLDTAGRNDYRPDAGLVAENANGVINMCYATCAVARRDDSGLVARNQGGSVERSLWDVQASGVKESDGGVGVNTMELMDVKVLQSNGWGGNPNWVLDDGKDYPRLIWEETPGSLIPAMASGK